MFGAGCCTPVAHQAEELSAVKLELAERESVHEFNPLVLPTDDTATIDDTITVMVVQRTLNDSARQRNVMICGIPETDEDDRVVLTKFCEDNRRSAENRL